MENEKRYLQTIYDELDQILADIEDKSIDDDDFAEDVEARIKKLVDMESQMRQQCDVGVRFSVIRNLIQSVNQYVKESIKQREIDDQPEETDTDSDKQDRVVYVYLFNILGRKLSAWYHLLSQQALMEHSVNRPIYGRREHIEELLRSKQSLEQHAYLVVSVDPEDITMDMSDSVLKDNLGNPLIRVRQGALRLEGVKYFHHMNQDYQVTKEGGLVEC